MMTARLCVASWGEDVGWVAGTGIEARVYDATGSREELIPVPNGAREAGQYLRHIIAHYGEFRDHEIFLQGNPFDHNPKILEALAGRRWEGRAVLPLGGAMIPCHPGLVLPHSDRLLPFAQQLGLNLGDLRPWTAGAMFAVSRETLEARPLDWWQMLLEKAVAERAWSPWILERLWLTIFHQV